MMFMLGHPVLLRSKYIIIITYYVATSYSVYVGTRSKYIIIII